MIDIHTHILPGMDDGAVDILDTIEMARLAAMSGVTEIVATPHFNIPGLYDNAFGEHYVNTFNQAARAIKEEKIPIRLFPGMEAFSTEDLPRQMADGKVMTINQSHYILMEFAFDEDPDFATRLLGKVREVGAKPVIAHAERYYFVQDDPQIVYQWRKKGYAIQVNKGSFLGRFGESAMETSYRLLRHHLVSVVASDAHSAVERTPFLMDALRRRLDHEVLGYTFACEEWYTSICSWLHKRHQWDVTRDMLTFVPGIVRGQAFALQCFTKPGDKVMVMTPVYHPFFLVTERLGREVVYSPLDLYDGHYHIDFERFSKDIRGCRLLILCNPHNPGGRVWTVEELRRIADICKESGTMVVSDEIHADLTLPPYKHHPFATVSEAAAQNSLTFMAPSKAFNMPGLGSSYAIAVNEDIRRRFREFMEAGEFCEGHLFAYIGAAAAYTHGEEWLEQVLGYVQANIDFTENYLKEHVPGIGMIRPQASYLVFLDCRALGLPQEKLARLFAEKAHLALNDGTMFGKPGEGFMRLNVGCPRSVLQKALEQLSAAVKEEVAKG